MIKTVIKTALVVAAVWYGPQLAVAAFNEILNAIWDHRARKRALKKKQRYTIVHGHKHYTGTAKILRRKKSFFTFNK